MSFPNEYVTRRVADTASKACDICYKATTLVLLSQSAEAKDFFYVCPIHLQDKKFCTPWVESGPTEAEKEKSLEAEKLKAIEEYKAAQKAKEEKKAKEGKDKDESKKETEKSQYNKTDKSTENNKKESKEDKDNESSTNKTSEPKFYILSQTFYDIRKRKRRDFELLKRQHQQAEQNHKRMAQGNFFPEVPQGPITKKA